MYAGRFAPSPTGPLHFGSLVAALASWLDARAARGRWLVRMEDLDAPRQQQGAADLILRTLERFGLNWDGPVLYQSLRLRNYEAALEKLRLHTYGCGCTRREISDSSLAVAADGARIYPGTCRAGLPPGKAARALRVKTGSEPVSFTDRVQGAQAQILEKDIGDFVVYRADLLDSTTRQIHLQRLLGYATPRYLHVPAAVNAAGEKLSKQTGARPIDAAHREQAICNALRFLGQVPTPDLEEAIANWDANRIPRRRAIPGGDG
jgi:glutamyl-Q tRNA(Asp) synthetase